MAMCSKEWCIDLLKKSFAKIDTAGKLVAHIICNTTTLIGKDCYIVDTADSSYRIDGTFNDDGYVFFDVDRLSTFRIYDSTATFYTSITTSQFLAVYNTMLNEVTDTV